LLNGQDADHHLLLLTNVYPDSQIFVVFDKDKFIGCVAISMP